MSFFWTAQKPFTMLVANLAAGGDPSRGKIGNPVKIRTSFTQQILPAVSSAAVDGLWARQLSGKTPGLGVLQGVVDTASAESASVVLTVQDNDFSMPSTLYVGPYGFTSDVDYVVAAATQATATVTVVAAPSAATVTIGGVGLVAAGGARSSGANNYDNTLGTLALIAANITAAINDAANGFDGFVAASNTGGSAVVTLTAVPVGADGNAVALASSGGSVTVSGASLTGGVDAVDNTATNLTAAISTLPNPWGAESTGPVVTIYGPVGLNGNIVPIDVEYTGTSQNFVLSSLFMEDGEPTIGPPILR